ncbi:MAG: phosphatase PAP2 family protein, partial [Actinomycetota bacterium]
RLEEIVTESFPSGHMAAAVTLYLGIVVIVSWHTTSTAVKALTYPLAVLFPLIVGVSRLYLGVHYLTDLIAGAALGVAAVIAALAIARQGLHVEVADSDEVEPPHTAALDLVDPGSRGPDESAGSTTTAP